MSEPPAIPADQHGVATYEIRLLGHLDFRWAGRLAVPTLTHDRDGTTMLSGIRADQAALHGLLQRIRDLGLTLVSVIRADCDPPRLEQPTAINTGRAKKTAGAAASPLLPFSKPRTSK